MSAFPRSLGAMLAFSAHACVVGALFSRIAEIQKAAGLSEDAFGLVLAGISVGVLGMSLVVSRILAVIGPVGALKWLPVFALTPIPVALAPGAGTMTLAMVAVGAMLALTNVATTVEADRIEATDGCRIMSRCHGAWGAGFLAVSLAGAISVRIGLPPVPFFAIVTGLVSCATILVFARMQPARPREGGAALRQRRFALPTLPVLLLMGFALSGVLLEGVARSWAVIYTRDATHAAEWLAALSLTAIVATQTMTRFVGDALVERLGAVAVARTLTLVAMAGLIILVAAPTTAMALVGCAVIGVGIALVHPLSVSAAARMGHRPAVENVAAFGFLQTMVGFAGPPLIGVIAAQSSLRIAFLCLVPLPLISLLFSRVIAPAPSPVGAATTAT